ncbi:MAG TPA: polysaccharide biosynthesis/export family protein [Candidatus Polarisedimenticolia bacterium]|nr:polysaccharide biosynthesis/export family protein [Candidatus Polarisedimenticolia bacterium]
MKTKSIVHHFVQLPFVSFILTVLLALVVAGCGTDQTIHYSQNPVIPPKDTKDAALREADIVKVTFPGTANLDATTQAIRRDGKITLPIIGEVVAAGKTPTQLEKELIDLYSTQLVSSKEITVQVQAASFPVFISGAVNRPGKLTLDHPITVLEAVMESGGFDLNRAKLNKIKVIRGQDKPGQTKTYTINLEGFLDGRPIDVFYLEPTDIVYVPSKIQWF